MRRRSDGDVEIFNFSFLDILACTIGALAFILTIILLDVAGRFSKDDVLREAQERLRQLQTEVRDVEDANRQLAERESEARAAIAALAPRAEQLAREMEQAVAAADQVALEARSARAEAVDLVRQAEVERDRNKQLADRQAAIASRLTTLEQERTELAAARETWDAKLADLKKSASQVAEKYEAALRAKEENTRLQSQVAALESAVEARRSQQRQAQQVLDDVRQLEDEEVTINREIADTQAGIAQAELRRAELAQADPSAKLVGPPYWLPGLLVLLALLLLVYWLNYRRRIPRGTPEELAAEIEQHQGAVARLQQSIEQTIEASQAREAGISASADVRDLKARANEAQAAAQAAEGELQNLQRELEDLEQTLRGVRNEKSRAREEIQQMRHGHAAVAPVPIVGPGGTDRVPTHVECTGSGLLIHPQQTRVGTSQISNTRSEFGQLVREVSQSGGRRCIVLWIRPDGLESFQKARDAAQECSAGVGWEPADREWNFLFA